MSLHPLVIQLHFARSEFVRCLNGVSETDAVKRLMPMNCISWYIGHLADQEQRYWIQIAQHKEMISGLTELVGHGKPASTPPLVDMWSAWQAITLAADDFLSTLQTKDLNEFLRLDGKLVHESIGTMLQRNLYHYWFHTGQVHSVRELLGHGDLPEFVGDMSTAVYRPES